MHLLPVLSLALLSVVTAQLRPFYAPTNWQYPGVHPMYLQNTTTSTTSSSTSPSTATATVAATNTTSTARPSPPASRTPTQTVNRRRPIEATRRTITSSDWSKPVKTRPGTSATALGTSRTRPRTTTTTSNGSSTTSSTSSTSSTFRPLMDANIENRVRDWPVERQPFWYLNREHIRDHINQ